MVLPCLVLFASLLVRTVSAGTHGCLKLDSLTLDKMLSMPGYGYLVKIDEPVRYGEQEQTFKSLCKLAYSLPDFFVGNVPVQQFNDKDNDDVRERFNLTKQDFPVYYLFTAELKDGFRYSGHIQAANIIKWLREFNIMMPSIDTIDELDALVNKFLKAPSEAHLVEAKSLVAKFSTDQKAPHYVKIMEKMLSKGPAYAKDEVARVMKLLGGKVHPEKQAELNARLKVLKVFAELEACDMYKCPTGWKKKFDAAGVIGTDTETCCNPPCADTDEPEHDAQGHHCSYYDTDRTARECGDWDTGQFRASKMCCSCGGGRREQ
mmetsp:Transcript_4847/g.8660  ORF Transcript_4847/g.8660 Transcript_4847/m.8660 type:complete len:319 (+) Transcript_4847:30-986(+)